MPMNFLVEKKIFTVPVIVWIIFIFGLLIRLIPVKYGLPLILNIDEPATVSATSSLKYSLNPHRFDWPHLFFYINFVFYGAGYYLEKIFTLPQEFQDRSLYLIISRSLVALFGSMTIISVYKIAKEAMQKDSIAVLSSLILCILPIHVYESHFAKPDIPMVFFSSVAIYMILKTYSYPSLKNYIWSGALIGLAMSTKYNAFLLYLPFVIVTIYNILGGRIGWDIKTIKFKYILYLFVSGAFSLIFFVIGTPFSILDFSNFWSYEPRIGVLWQFSNVGNVEWVYYSSQVYETFINMYRSDLGLFIWVIFILVVIQYLFFNRRNAIYNILLLPVILISLYISKLDRSPSHYFLFLAPMYVPLIAEYVYGIYAYLSIFTHKEIVQKALFAIILIDILLPSFYSSIKSVYSHSLSDPRTDAYIWFKKNIKENEYHVYTYGEEMTNVVFQEKRADRIKRVDDGDIEEPTPFLLVIGSYGATPNSLKENNYDSKVIRGNYKRIISDATLLFYQNNLDRVGPPVMIYKVNNIQSDNDQINSQ